MRSGPRRRYELKHAGLNASIEALVAEAESVYGEFESSEMIREVLVSALRLMRDKTARGDLKIVNSALKELRHAFQVFAPYRHVRKVAVWGSARTKPEHHDFQQAQAFAERMADEGWMSITGAGGGIMGAAQLGAGREASFGVNIRLPFEQTANEVIAGDPKLMNFRFFFTRKVMFVKEAHALALFPGGFGTHDEGFEVLTLIQTGKSEILPIVLVEAPGDRYWRDWLEYVKTHMSGRELISPEDLALFKVTDDVEAAVSEILMFYSNYHSSRFVGGRLILRVRHAPDAAQLEGLNEEFSDILTEGEIEASEALESEAGEAPGYPRLALRFNRRDVGRLRMLIDRLNAMVPETASPAGEASPHEIIEEAIPPEDETAEQAED